MLFGTKYDLGVTRFLSAVAELNGCINKNDTDSDTQFVDGVSAQNRSVVVCCCRYGACLFTFVLPVK